ncbi:HIT domain-containing protein [Candidatus Parcubacteria bacterium]|nr:HIT domain-containing protein [Candidatus Parcubacteria bacterium]
MSKCLFCQIIAGEEPSQKVLETEDFLVIENKFPVAPTHLSVLSKVHKEKSDCISGRHEGFWDEMMAVCWSAIQRVGLDKTGYKLVNNGAGYNHFEHEHMHILGGSREEPAGKT